MTSQRPPARVGWGESGRTHVWEPGNDRWFRRVNLKQDQPIPSPFRLIELFRVLGGSPFGQSVVQAQVPDLASQELELNSLRNAKRIDLPHRSGTRALVSSWRQKTVFTLLQIVDFHSKNPRGQFVELEG